MHSNGLVILLRTNNIVAGGDAAVSREITDVHFLSRIGKLVVKNKETPGPGLGGGQFLLFCLTFILFWSNVSVLNSDNFYVSFEIYFLRSDWHKFRILRSSSEALYCFRSGDHDCWYLWFIPLRFRR